MRRSTEELVPVYEMLTRKMGDPADEAFLFYGMCSFEEASKENISDFWQKRAQNHGCYLFIHYTLEKPRLLLAAGIRSYVDYVPSAFYAAWRGDPRKLELPKDMSDWDESG